MTLGCISVIVGGILIYGGLYYCVYGGRAVIGVLMLFAGSLAAWHGFTRLFDGQ